MVDSGHFVHRRPLYEIRQACRTCNLADLCLPLMLSPEDIDALDRIVRRRRPLVKRGILYRAGERFGAIYAVRSGSLKRVSLTEDGEEQITAFHLPGELLGLGAITFDRYPCTAVALETTSVCEIPFAQLEDLATEIPGLQRQLLRIMSREIFNEQEMLRTLARRTAEQRLAILLLSLSERFARRSLSSTRFRLPMLRRDLSNYLGLASETTSRLFKRFVEQGRIAVSGREVELIDMHALHSLAGNALEESGCDQHATGGAQRQCAGLR